MIFPNKILEYLNIISFRFPAMNSPFHLPAHLACPRADSPPPASPRRSHSALETRQGRETAPRRRRLTAKEERRLRRIGSVRGLCLCFSFLKIMHTHINNPSLSSGMLIGFKYCLWKSVDPKLPKPNSATITPFMKHFLDGNH